MKNLKQGESIISHFGDEWAGAILVVDKIELDFRTQVLRFYVDIYKDAQARTEGRSAMSNAYIVDKDTFLAEFDVQQPAISLNGQCEAYALTLTSDDGTTLIYNQFE